MELLHDFRSVWDYITANRGLKYVSLSKRTIKKIRHEMENMTFIQPTPRPTYGPPFGDIDRLLWDSQRAMMDIAPIRICDTNVVPK